MSKEQEAITRKAQSFNPDVDYSSEIKKRVESGASASEINALVQARDSKIASDPNRYGKVQSSQDYLKSLGWNSEFENIKDSSQQMADASFQSQKAQLDTILAQQTAELQKAYEDAIVEGKISVRDAQEQFEAQKGDIYKQAYLDSESTDLYAQNMGIQNSQQMVGLMQGDNARKTSLINANIKDRDSRINDIKDRINSITQKKNLDLARIQAEHGYGLVGARAQADQLHNQNVFGLMQDEYSAKRNHGFNIELQDKAHENTLSQMKVGFKYDLEKMKVGHGYDLEKMDVQLEHTMKQMAQQFGYQKQMEAIQNSNRMGQIKAQQRAQAKQIQDEYEVAKKRELAKFTKGTDEYKIREAQMNEAMNNAVVDMHLKTSYDAITKDPNLPENSGTKNMPTKNFWNSLTGGYNKDLDAYVKQQEAIKRKSDFLANPSQFLK